MARAEATAEAPHGAAPSAGGLKVIGTGLGRTGTSSLKAALEILYPGQKCYHLCVRGHARGSVPAPAWRLRPADAGRR